MLEKIEGATLVIQCTGRIQNYTGCQRHNTYGFNQDLDHFGDVCFIYLFIRKRVRCI